MQLQPAVAASLESWHHMIASGDLSALPSIVDADAVFRSPVANTSRMPARRRWCWC